MITSSSSNVSLSIAPQSPYSGKDVREIMAKQVRCYDEVLSRSCCWLTKPLNIFFNGHSVWYKTIYLI